MYISLTHQKNHHEVTQMCAASTYFNREKICLRCAPDEFETLNELTTSGQRDFYCQQILLDNQRIPFSFTFRQPVVSKDVLIEKVKFLYVLGHL